MNPEAAARAYGLDPRHLEPVASVYRPAAAYRAGAVLLKPFRSGERQLYYTTAALRHLQQRGCRLVPRLVETRAGQPYVRIGETWFYATTWIAGRPPRFPADLDAAAGALAAFHTASEGCFIPYSANRSWRRRWQQLLADLIDFRRLALAGDTEFDRLYVYASGAFLRQTLDAVAALDACGYDTLEADVRRRRAFCHRDLTAANLVVDGAGRVCLVDPDTWGPELRSYDLARLLLTGDGPDGAAPDPARALGALAAYEAGAPLPAAERRLLPWAYVLPREYWWAGVCRYRRPAPGVDPERLLRATMAAAPARAACAQALREAIKQ